MILIVLHKDTLLLHPFLAQDPLLHYILLHLRVDLKVFDYPQVLGMLVVANPDGLVDAMLLDERPQLSHLLIHVIHEIEVVKLCQSQLTVIIIEAFLRYANLPRSLLEVYFLFWISRLCLSLVQIPPMFNQRDDLRYRPLLAPKQLFISRALLFALILADPSNLVAFLFTISDEDNVGLEVAFGYEAVLCVDCIELLELITFRIVDGDVEAVQRGVDREDCREVNERRPQIDLFFHKFGLFCLLFLENKSPDR